MKNLISFFLFLLLIFLNSCSFDGKSGIWKEHNKKIIEEAKTNENFERIFKKKEIFDEEIQSQDIVIVSKKNRK